MSLQKLTLFITGVVLIGGPGLVTELHADERAARKGKPERAVTERAETQDVAPASRDAASVHAGRGAPAGESAVKRSERGGGDNRERGAAASVDRAATSSKEATAGSSDRAGGYNIERAMSGRGVGGTPPDPAAPGFGAPRADAPATSERSRTRAERLPPKRAPKENAVNEDLSPSPPSRQANDRGVGTPFAAVAASAAAVRDALASDVSLEVESIEVHEAGQKLLLKGTVRTAAVRERVEAIARGAAGTTPVDNNLKVRSRGRNESANK